MQISITPCGSVPRLLLLMLLFMVLMVAPTTSFNASVKEGEGLGMAAPPDSGAKCTACSSCQNPCGQHPPPPPPPPPPKSPSKQYCPPPPPVPYTYVYGPPGNLYPIDPNFSGSSRNSAVGWPLSVGFGLVLVLGFWRF